MQTSSVELFEHVVSQPRLNSYKRFFKAKTMDEAIGLYLWNGEISGCFASHLAYFEVILRNSIHRAMSSFYSRGESASCHWYDLIRDTLKHASRKKIDDVRKRHGGGEPCADEIVASLSFGFWPVILNNIAPAHAARLLPAIFPHHPLGGMTNGWGDAAGRRIALNFAFELHAFRNRLAHHEPLWKFRALRDSLARPPVTVMAAPRGPADSIVRLRRLLDMIEEATGFIAPMVCADLREATWRKRLDFLLSERGIERYRRLRHVPGSVAMTPREFRRGFTRIGRLDQPVRVRQSRSSGLFIPD